MAALAVVVLVGVVFRKAGASLVWYDEVASILLAWLTYYGAALAALHRAHIGMPTLVARLRGRPRGGDPRGRGVHADVLRRSGVGGRARAVGARGTGLTSLPWMPMTVAQSVIPIGAVLFIIAQLVSLPDVLRGTTEAPESDDSGEAA